MKPTSRSSARFMIAKAVFSSQPTLCMNDFSSASPNVIAPRHSTGTFRPLLPRDRYSIARPPSGTREYSGRRRRGRRAEAAVAIAVGEVDDGADGQPDAEADPRDRRELRHQEEAR